jgi:hypothetical protein
VSAKKKIALRIRIRAANDSPVTNAANTPFRTIRDHGPARRSDRWFA